MERHTLIMPHICRWEGGLTNNPNDSASRNPCPVAYKGVSGYHTNMGITWTTWTSYCKAKGITDVKTMAAKFYAMTKADQTDVFKVLYWDKVCAGDVKSLPVANISAQWGWGSGPGGIVKGKPVGALICMNDYAHQKGLAKTALISNWKSAAVFINNMIEKEGERKVFDDMCEVRKAFFIRISAPGSKNAVFQKGWLNRLKEFKTFNEPFFGKKEC